MTHRGKFIRQQLEARNWSQEDLAAALDIPLKEVNFIVAGRIPINEDVAGRLAKAFDMPAELFLEGLR